MFVLLLASIFGFAQDQDGAIERVARAEQAYHQRLSEVATAFEQIEAKVGAAEVAELFVAQAVRAQREALDRASESLSTLSRAQADEAFLRLESVSDSAGSVWLRRVLRNAKRESVDSYDRLRAVQIASQKFDVEKGLARLLADHGGSVSKVLRAAARMNEEREGGMQIPFRFTAGWVGFVNNTKGEAYYGNLVWSIFVMPLAIGGDLLLLPFQLVYLAGQGLVDLFSTSSDERTIETLRSRIQDLTSEVNNLRRELDSRPAPGEVGEIRRDR